MKVDHAKAERDARWLLSPEGHTEGRLMDLDNFASCYLELVEQKRDAETERRALRARLAKTQAQVDELLGGNAIALAAIDAELAAYSERQEIDALRKENVELRASAEELKRHVHENGETD